MYFESINESIFPSFKEYKKNCIPIDYNSIPKEARLACINTHLFNIAVGAIQGQINMLKVDLIASLILRKLTMTPFWLKAIFTAITTVPTLISQFDARDFMLFPKDIIKILEDKDNVDNQRITEDIMDLGFKIKIIACNDGKVVKTYNKIRESNKLGNIESVGGNYIVLSHFDDAYYSVYAHLQKDSLRVKEGDSVKKGQFIGMMGSTGNSSAPHLHFGMYSSNPDHDLTGIGKPLSNFESFKYIPYDMYSLFRNESYYKNLISTIKKGFIVNKDGKIPNSCLLT